jgi:hypothetical protein
MEEFNIVVFEVMKSGNRPGYRRGKSVNSEIGYNCFFPTFLKIVIYRLLYLSASYILVFDSVWGTR